MYNMFLIISLRNIKYFNSHMLISKIKSCGRYNTYLEKYIIILLDYNNIICSILMPNKL